MVQRRDTIECCNSHTPELTTPQNNKWVFSIHANWKQQVTTLKSNPTITKDCLIKKKNKMFSPQIEAKPQNPIQFYNLFFMNRGKQLKNKTIPIDIKRLKAD